MVVASCELLKNYQELFFSGGELPTVLQEIDLSILSNDDCGHGTLPNIMVCAKNPKGSPCKVRIYYFGMNFSTLKYSMLTSSEKRIHFLEMVHLRNISLTVF